MKTYMTETALAVTFVLLASTAFAQTQTIDECEVKLVEGTNYYNLVDPTCKGPLEIYASTEAEKKQKARREEEEKEEPTEPVEPVDPPSDPVEPEPEAPCKSCAPETS